MFPSIRAVFRDFFRSSHSILDQHCIKQPPLEALGFNDFLNLDIPARELLLDPILPERSLLMLYAPRGVGKTLLALSIGLAIAGGTQILRWSAPRRRKVLYVDGEMPIISLQERVRTLSASVGCASIPNDRFRLLAADNIENGINLSDAEGQRALDPLLNDVDLLILDNLSTLCPNRSESASEAWTPIQSWLLKLRRRGISVLLIHHAGLNGRQRGTSRREDALDVVIALRRPEDYSPEHGARFEIHFEKLRNRVDAEAARPFESKLESKIDSQVVRWTSCEIKQPIVARAAELFEAGLTVREVAANLRISKSEAGRLRLQAIGDERPHRSSDEKTGYLHQIRR
jgi:putative DNA primase/helicase